jgi:hypothetical protein
MDGGRIITSSRRIGGFREGGAGLERDTRAERTVESRENGNIVSIPRADGWAAPSVFASAAEGFAWTRFCSKTMDRSLRA